ncbi:uncharacterized protein LOC126981248 [Eriocheir sinensis]|uniref:uncharacterized protein LOC126981248 n=1 Tax=Eriocheir sinensis TaxID=95602 RepID=UPI0021C7EC84|nr:uncharacterized protein LOC126981248 [Eriocheir sinensis]
MGLITTITTSITTIITTSRRRPSTTLLLFVLLLLVGSWAEAKREYSTRREEGERGGGGGGDGGGGGGGRGKKECDPRHLQQCMKKLEAINEDHDLAFASTEPELDEMCHTMGSGLNCVKDHISRCFKAARQQLIYQLLTGTEDVIHSLCMPGAFREKYLQHSPCMKNLSVDPQMCGKHYHRLISSVDPAEKLEFEDSIRQQCCAFHNYLLCVTSAAERECSSKASYFIEEYSYRTARPIIQTRCKVYVPGSLECTYSRAPNSRAAPFLHLALLLSLTLLLLPSPYFTLI